MANRDYDDDRRYGGPQYQRGSRWTQGSDDMRSTPRGSEHDRSYGDRPYGDAGRRDTRAADWAADWDDRQGGESWGERVGNRIGGFVRDFDREYLGGMMSRRGDRPMQAQDEWDRRDRSGQGYGQGYGQGGDETGRPGYGPGYRPTYGPGYGQGGGYGPGGSGGQHSQYSRSGGQSGRDSDWGAGSSRDEGSRDWGSRDWGGGRDWGHRDYGSSTGASGMGGGYAAGGAYGGSTYAGYGASADSRADTRGRPPKSYTRSDARIEEDVNERLSRGGIDASEITVSVKDGEVTLAGTVPSRADRRRAEDLADDVSGVKHVQNNARVREAWGSGGSGAQAYGQSYGRPSDEADTWAGGPMGGQTGGQTGGQSRSRSPSQGSDDTSSATEVPAASYGASNPKTS